MGEWSSRGCLRHMGETSRVMDVLTAAVRMGEGARGRERERVDQAHRAPCDTRRRRHKQQCQRLTADGSIPRDGRVDSTCARDEGKRRWPGDEGGRRGGERRMVRVQWRAYETSVGEDVEHGAGSAGTMRHRSGDRELTAARRVGEMVVSTAVEWVGLGINRG